MTQSGSILRCRHIEKVINLITSPIHRKVIILKFFMSKDGYGDNPAMD